MSTAYFILSKSRDKEISNNEQDTLVTMTNRINYILPRTLLSCYADNGLFESMLIDWAKQFCKEDKVILDIGAHTGTYTMSLAPYCKHVYAFEPQKMTYYALCGGVALSNLRNVTCVNKGLGSADQVGEMTLHIVSSDGGGSTIQLESESVLATETIVVDMLDNMNLQDISFIKMDVENNEKYVLEGAVETIKRCNYPHILFECNDRVKHEDLFSFIEGLSYNIIIINGVQNMYLACK